MGALSKAKFGNDAVSQTEFLEADGLPVKANTVQDFERVFIASLDLPSGLAQQQRPENAPKR